MNARYLLGALISTPLLPLMYYQGKRIRKSVPELPEADGVEGKSRSYAKSERALKLIALGESTIAGIGVSTHEEGFTGTFAREISRLLGLNMDWKVYARSGYTAKRVKTHIVPSITEKEADLIIIGLGGNDAFTLNRPGKWKVQIQQLIESLRSRFPGAIMVFCNMPPIKEFPAFTPLIKFTVGNLVEILGEELEKIVGDYPDVFYTKEKITLQGWAHKFSLDAKREDFFSDGVHPSKLTYQTWAKDIANEIIKEKEIKKALGQNR